MIALLFPRGPRRALRVGSWLATILLAGLLGLHAWAAGPSAAGIAQDAAAPPGAQPDAADEIAPADPWNRGTPRRSVQGFLEATRDGRWEDAVHYLDLSSVPQQQREEQGKRVARQLDVVLDQKLWIDTGMLSDEASGHRDDGLRPNRDLIGRIEHPRGDLEVQVTRVPRESDGVLVWKLDAQTVSRAPELYAEIGLGGLLEVLPRSLVETRFLEVALWQWIGLFLLVVMAWAGSWLLAWGFATVAQQLTKRSRTDIDDRVLALMIGPIRLLATIGLFNAGLHLLVLSVPANTFARECSKFLVIAAVAWLIFRMIDLFAGVMKERLEQRGQAGAVHLVPVGARALKVAVFVMTVLATLDTFGFDVTALIAGLGIGGLAVALAAQKTLENIFGGASVLVDQPVRPGDFCRFGDKLGTVEDIGMRSTRIRTLDRTVISVPNAEFSTLQLENFARRDRIRLIAKLGLRYETTPDQLRYVLERMRHLLNSHEKVVTGTARVRFVAFGSSSLDIEFLAFVDTTAFDEFLEIREEIYLRVMDLVAESGTGFAFPSTTTYFRRDSGVDAERTTAAEAHVQAWRARGGPMFPDDPAEDVASSANGRVESAR